MRTTLRRVTRSSADLARWGLFGLIVTVLTVGYVGMATAEGGNVRYSYAEVSVAGEGDYALIPHAVDQLSGEVTHRTVERAFESLRQNNEQMYGNSYASASGDEPARMEVEVHIDSDKSDFAPYIKAEAVYTLTELGVPEVEFPGYADEGLTRADIGTPAYTLTVPVWRVLPPGRVTSAQIRMADGELIDTDELERRWQEEREALVDEVYAFLDSEKPFMVRQVVEMLPNLGELRFDEVTPLLVDDDRRVREQALEILEEHDDESAVLAAVSEAVDEESSSSLARRMAEFLGGSPDDDYSVEYQFYLIEKGDDEEAEEAVEAIADWDDDERVVETLIDVLRDDRSELAAVAAESLDELDVHDPRIEALDDGAVSSTVRLQLAEDLSAEANPVDVRLAGLTHIAEERSGGHANQALRTMGALDIDEARTRIEEFLEDSSRDRRRTAMETLVDRNDVESVPALMEASTDREAAREAAYEIMVAQPLDEIIEQTEVDSMAVQEVAFRAVGQRAATQGGRDEAVETIEAGIDHRQSAIRGAAATSLAQIGGDDALETLGELTDDPSPEVRRDVALALGEFSGDRYADTLVDYLDDDDPDVVAAAIDAMEQREDSRAEDQIEELLDAEAPQIRASALRAVTTFLPDDNQDRVREHMGMLSGAVGDDSTEVQKAALEQLGRFEQELAVTNIATLVGSEDVGVRIEAVQALAATGHDDARRLLESALDDEAPEVRRAAIEALTELAGSQARPQLEARVEEEDDPEVKELLEQHLQQI